MAGRTDRLLPGSLWQGGCVMAFYANYGRGGKRMKQIVTCKEMKALDGNMEEQIYEGEGLLARAFCHEIDHLDGKMYTELVEGELHKVTYDEED